MKTTIFRSFLLILFIPFGSFAQIKLEKKSFIDNKIEILVPANFKSMSAEALEKKYPNRNHTPDVVLTDENGGQSIISRLDIEQSNGELFVVDAVLLSKAKQ